MHVFIVKFYFLEDHFLFVNSELVPRVKFVDFHVSMERFSAKYIVPSCSRFHQCLRHVHYVVTEK